LREGIETGAEDHVLIDATTRVLDDEIFDEATARNHRGAKTSRPLRVHVLAIAPTLVGRRERETQFVFVHVRRRIDLNVHRTPQCGAHRSAVRSSNGIVGHGVGSPFAQ
jgi:hypothetical protein